MYQEEIRFVEDWSQPEQQQAVDNRYIPDSDSGALYYAKVKGTYDDMNDWF